MGRYRHQHHAGNHGDLLKHGVLALLLEQLRASGDPLVYLESHAGAGRYDLDAASSRAVVSIQAQRGRLPGMSSYFDAIESLNPSGGVRSYPGSPCIAAHCLRAQDRLLLVELAGDEVATLRSVLAGDPRAEIRQGDGFAALPRLVPGGDAPGLALIDPPYVSADDSERAAACLLAAAARWPGGVFAIWYPHRLAGPDHGATLVTRLLSAVPSVFVLELGLGPEPGRRGLDGSGMILVHPPPGIDASLRPLMADLAESLAGTRGRWRLEWLSQRA